MGLVHTLSEYVRRDSEEAQALQALHHSLEQGIVGLFSREDPEKDTLIL